MRWNDARSKSRHRASLYCLSLIVSATFSWPAYAHRLTKNDKTATSSVTITVTQYASEDSSAVTRFSAALYDAGTNALLDSLSSGATNTVSFPNITTVGVEKSGNTVPTGYGLEQNYPNPFNPSTIVRFSIPKPDNVSLTVFDILGRKIATLVDQKLSSGTYQVTWNPSVASGVYLYRIQSSNFSQTRKMIALDGSGHAAGPSRIAALGAVIGSVHETQSPSLTKVQSGSGYVLRLYNLTSLTNPQMVNRSISIPNLTADTTIHVYSLRAGAHIYPDSIKQIIRGFGGANVFIFGRPDMTPAEVQSAYGSGDGQIGLTIMRVSIPPDSTQFRAYVPSALAAEALGAKVIATPWTPPAWMKSNNSLVGGSLNPSAYAAYASHLKAFSDTLASYGVSVYATSVQNEPDANVNYQSCSWNGTQFLNFMKNNAPAVGMPVFMPESEGFNHTYSDATLNDSAATANTAFIGGHIYGATPSSYALALSKGKETWMTEYLINGTIGGVNMDTTMAGALSTAKSINDCMNANMSAYVWWYTLRYYGPIDDGTLGGVAGSVTKKGYVMSQYARFVRPGYRRINADANPQTSIYVTAYKNGSKTVIVALNLNSSAINQAFVIPHGSTTTYSSYVTSSSKNCLEGDAFMLSGLSFTATLDPSSVTTFVSD
jgi:glucuronoarabinoxylan endo-1,4-beta-xylanase